MVEFAEKVQGIVDAKFSTIERALQRAIQAVSKQVLYRDNWLQADLQKVQFATTAEEKDELIDNMLNEPASIDLKSLEDVQRKLRDWKRELMSSVVEAAN